MRTDQIFQRPEGNDNTIDTVLRQAIGQEPVLSFTRAGDSPVQWIQLLHALDQQDLPGWPLLSPPKIQMLKCDKCTREFCSPINHRRHKRLHRRSMKNDKDFAKNRGFLGAFWDKLSSDDAKDAISFKDVMLEDVPGSSIINALNSLIRKPGFYSLPQDYLRAGTTLLDIIQARPTRFPVTSHELFNILDDASEGTFLCAGTALSMQKFVFDREAGKIGLEMKNLIACTGFLVEQKLVKEWLADKDVEALRCHKLLVEEEEASQKRQIELLERRRLKKLRHKEHKTKDQVDEKEAGAIKNSLELSEILIDEEALRAMVASNSSSSISESLSDSAQPLIEHAGSHYRPNVVDIDTVFDILDLHDFETVDRKAQQRNDRQHLNRFYRPVANQQRGLPNGFHLAKSSLAVKHVNQRDKRSATPLSNSHKIWTKKTKSESGREDVNSTVQKSKRGQLEQTDNLRCKPELNDKPRSVLKRNESCEVMIGSIAIMLDQFASYQQPKSSDDNENAPKQLVKLGNSVGRQEVGDLSIVQNCKGGTKGANDASKIKKQLVVSGSCAPRHTPHNMVGSTKVFEDGEESTCPRPICDRSAESFLTQRWKEAIAGDHVKLVPSLEKKLPDVPENQPAHSASINGAVKAMFRAKHEKGSRVKYIPKQNSSKE